MDLWSFMFISLYFHCECYFLMVFWHLSWILDFPLAVQLPIMKGTSGIYSLVSVMYQVFACLLWVSVLCVFGTWSCVATVSSLLFYGCMPIAVRCACVCEVEEKDCFVLHRVHSHTHNTPCSLPPSWNQTFRSWPSAISSRPSCSVPAPGLAPHLAPAPQRHPPPPPVSLDISTALIPPCTSVCTAAITLAAVRAWIGALCEQERVWCRGLSQFPLNNSGGRRA